jgi:hypothetical protein
LKRNTKNTISRNIADKEEKRKTIFEDAHMINIPGGK